MNKICGLAPRDDQSHLAYQHWLEVSIYCAYKLSESILLSFLLCSGQLDLYAINTIDAIDKENQDEYKCDLEAFSQTFKLLCRESNLHAILQFRYQRIFRNEIKEFSLPGERKRNDKQHENAHLCNEQ